MKSRDQSLNMHRFFIVAGIVAVYSMVILNTVSAGAAVDVVHICCYTTDPNLYEPKCYDCDNMVYKNALMACVNMTDLPKNISYKAANCLEKNCQIQIPKISEADVMKNNYFFDLLALLASRPKRSLSDNSIGGSDINSNRHVVKEVSTFVSNDEPAAATLTFLDPEYM